MDKIPRSCNKLRPNWDTLYSSIRLDNGRGRKEIAGKDDKRQLTAVFAGSMSGESLPPQLIYQGKTTRCLPHYDFPAGWHLIYSPNHWSNEETMKEYIEHIILPYIHGKRKQLKLADDYPALLTFDNSKAQCRHGNGIMCSLLK